MSEKYLINEEKFREQIVRRILLFHQFNYFHRKDYSQPHSTSILIFTDSIEFNTNNILIFQKLFSINLCSDKNKIEYVSKN